MGKLIKPLRDFVHIKPFYTETISKSGIILPKDERLMNVDQYRGKVLALGPDVYDLAVGDEVIFQNFGAKLEDGTTMVGFGYIDCKVVNDD